MSASELEEAVLHLPLRERAHLAQKLLESLDLPSEEEARQAWLREAQRRAQDIDQGKVQMLSSEELELQVRSLLK